MVQSYFTITIIIGAKSHARQQIISSADYSVAREHNFDVAMKLCNEVMYELITLDREPQAKPQQWHA